MPRTRLGDVELFYEITGKGDPLVLVHGSWVDAQSWEAIVPTLARSFRVVTYDRRGHSRSERPTGQGSVRQDVADLAALIEHLSFAPAHVVGNSFGGAIALRLAATRPELVRSLQVHEPALGALLAGDPASKPIVAAVLERIGGVMAELQAGRMADGARRFVEEIAIGSGGWAMFSPRDREIFVQNAPTFLDELRDPESPTMDLAPLRAFTSPALLTLGDQARRCSPASST